MDETRGIKTLYDNVKKMKFIGDERLSTVGIDLSSNHNHHHSKRRSRSLSGFSKSDSTTVWTNMKNIIFSKDVKDCTRQRKPLRYFSTLNPNGEPNRRPRIQKWHKNDKQLHFTTMECIFFQNAKNRVVGVPDGKSDIRDRKPIPWASF